MNMLQLKAMILALNAFLDRITGKSLVLVSDNASVVACLKKHGGTISKVLCDLAQEVVPWPEIHLIALTESYVCRKKNILMDQLSHPDQVLPMEWSFLPWVFDLICEVFGRPYIDLFAMRANTKLLLYVSPWHGSRTLFHISGTISTPLPPPPPSLSLSGIVESDAFNKTLFDSDCSFLASRGAVHQSVDSFARRISQTFLTMGPAGSAPCQEVSSWSRDPPPSHEETVKCVSERLAFWERLQRSSLLISGVPWQHLSERVV